jgi:hypothetical protein
VNGSSLLTDKKVTQFRTKATSFFKNRQDVETFEKLTIRLTNWPDVHIVPVG